MHREQRHFWRKGEQKQSNLHTPAYGPGYRLIVVELPIEKLLRLGTSHTWYQLRAHLQDIENGLLSARDLQLTKDEKGAATDENEHNQCER